MAIAIFQIKQNIPVSDISGQALIHITKSHPNRHAKWRRDGKNYYGNQVLLHVQVGLSQIQSKRKCHDSLMCNDRQKKADQLTQVLLKANGKTFEY